jgi:hypothetical protein
VNAEAIGVLRDAGATTLEDVSLERARVETIDRTVFAEPVEDRRRPPAEVARGLESACRPVALQTVEKIAEGELAGLRPDDSELDLGAPASQESLGLRPFGLAGRAPAFAPAL